MIKFFKKLLETSNKKRDISYMTCLPSSSLSYLSDSESESESEELEIVHISDVDTESEDSSSISYDSDIDYSLQISKSFPDLFVDKLNHVAELKRQLSFYKDMPCNKMRKWFLYYALYSLEKIGFYPQGMPFTKSELLSMVVRHQEAMQQEGHCLASVASRYLVGIDSYDSFELLAKSPIQKDKIYSMGCDEFGQTLLHHAVRWNNYALVKKLLELEFCPNFEDHEGKTPIYGCVGKLHHRKSNMANLLLKYGANPYHKLYSGKTLLDKAIQKGNVNLTILLVTKYGFEFGPRKNTFKTFPKWAQKKLIKFWLS